MKSYSTKFVEILTNIIAQSLYAHGKNIFYKIGEDNYGTVLKNTEFYDFRIVNIIK